MVDKSLPTENGSRVSDGSALKRVTLSIFGVVVGAIGIFAAFVLAGLGEGWGAPFLFSLPLVGLYPIVLVRLHYQRRSVSSFTMGMLLLLAAVIADISLGLLTVQYEITYFVDAYEGMFFWLVLWGIIWFLWQVLAAYELIALRASDIDY